MHLNFYILGRVVVYFSDFDLSLLYGLEYGLNQRGGVFAEGDVGYHQGAGIQLGDFGPYFYLSPPQAVVVTRNIQHSSGGEVGIQFKAFARSEERRVGKESRTR